MVVIPIAFGAIIALIGLLLCVRPAWIHNFLAKYGEQSSLHIVAVISRLVLGAALVLTASMSQYPLIMYWLGWLTVMAAIGLALIGGERFARLLAWAQGLTARYGRIVGVLAIAFGVFLLRAYV